jgi:hypothetical protein
LISFTRETLERIRNATNDFLEIIQVPFSTIQKSGGSVRCTVQEVACSESACKPNLQKPYYFSERIEQFENQHLLSGISLFRPKISPSFDSLNPQEHAAHEYR